MNGEEAIRLIQAHMIAHNIGVYPHIRLAKALDMAISALRTQQELESKLRVLESNKPLTLDELRKMEGQPVWMHTFSAVQKKTSVAQWAILETVGSANATFLRAGVNSRLTKWFCNYGERWFAYRRNPEEGEK